MVNGIMIGIMELSLYILSSFLIRKKWNRLENIDIISYYWFMMTILTFIWEVSFISDYSNVSEVSHTLLDTKTHVWTNGYNLSYIFPWKVARIFYGEYGAYADRDYMNSEDDWSRIIEGTHALFCGIFALWAVIAQIRGNKKQYLITSSISMGSQLMNSLLYMANYMNETHNPTSINYNNESFPTGSGLVDRPFMYVNLFWTFMPLYAIIRLLCMKNWYPTNSPIKVLKDEFSNAELTGFQYLTYV